MDVMNRRILMMATGDNSSRVSSTWVLFQLPIIYYLGTCKL